MPTAVPSYPSRVPCTFQGNDGQVVVDQIRSVDESRIERRLGTIDEPIQMDVLATPAQMFAE
jgi:mRNA interferase MazF